jgi:DNA-directed RNA polymerase specialized sigma24 family protein
MEITTLQKDAQRAILTVAHRDFQKGLNLHAYFKIHDHAIGEGLVQDTFMKTWSISSKAAKST